MDLLSRIKEISNQKGMSIKEVAIKAGIGENTIYRWKKSKPSISSLTKVAQALNGTVDELTADPNDIETPEYRAIQRRAKRMTPENQKKLLQMMDLAFGQLDKGSEEND